MYFKETKKLPCELCLEGIPHGGQVVPSKVFAPEMLVNIVVSFCNSALEASIPDTVGELFRANRWLEYLDKKYDYRARLIRHLEHGQVFLGKVA